VLYRTALGIGFLSDDFVLIDRAAHYELSALNADAFRPVPVALWAALLSAAGGARTLHLVNIVLHGANAYLTTRIVDRLLEDRRWSILAGLLFLVFPIAPEAVVWCSGVFDVAATTAVLGSILIARRYEIGASAGVRAGLYLLAAAAVLSKETAVVVVPLILFDAVVRRALTKTLTRDLAVLALVAGAYAAARMLFASAAMKETITRYMLQRDLLLLFGSLTIPWQADVIRRHSAIALLCVSTVIALFTRLWVVGLLVLLMAPGLHWHLQTWRSAAAERDRIERAAQSDPAVRACRAVSLAGVTDSVSGAYVFRNGLREAFDRDLGVHISADADVAPGCAFTWTGDRFVRRAGI
jgi:hypothetical protein